MIQFRCPQCGKALNVRDEKAGRKVTCRQCGGKCVAPEAADGADEPAGRALAAAGESAPGLLTGLSRREWWAVAGAAAVGVVSLLLLVVQMIVGGGEMDMTAWAVPLTACSVVVILAILHGHATGCPECGRWWSRGRVEKTFVDREVFDKGGVPFARSVYQTTYECGNCSHRWAVTDTDEYPESVRDRPRGQQG